MRTQPTTPSSRSWLITALISAVVLTVFNIDPIGDVLVKQFGEGADRWAINIFLIAVIAYLFLKKK